MSGKFREQKLILASHNRGKLAEFERLFAPLGVEIVSAHDLNLPEPDETGTSFAENALLKAHAAAKAAQMPALADDSGLSVAALGGDPGIYSARWAGPEKDFTTAMTLVHEGLGDKSRKAAFIAVLAIAFPDGQEEVFEGRCEGEIVWPPRGNQGFGYDPIFVPQGATASFAEMTSTEKAAYSHRAKAFALLKDKLFD